MSDTQDTQWMRGVPTLGKGKAETFIVCCQQADGIRTARTAIYMQDYWMDWEDDFEHEEAGKHHTGWMCDQESASGWLSTRPLGKNVIGWLPLPAPMSKPEEPEETYNDDVLECPYCHHITRDCYELGQGHVEEHGEIECGKCDRDIA